MMNLGCSNDEAAVLCLPVNVLPQFQFEHPIEFSPLPQLLFWSKSSEVIEEFFMERESKKKVIK